MATVYSPRVPGGWVVTDVLMTLATLTDPASAQPRPASPTQRAAGPVNLR